MNLLVLAPNLLQLFAGWELVGITSYLLIGFYFGRPSAARAAVKAFWLTKLADMGFLFALLLLFASTGSLELDAWRPRRDVATAVTAASLLGGGGQVGTVPAPRLAPRRHGGPHAGVGAAPRSDDGSRRRVPPRPRRPAVRPGRPHARRHAAGSAPPPRSSPPCWRCVQTDIKKVLAYSTCSQLGYMVAAIGAGSAFAGFFHLGTHAFFKALLFLAAGSVIHAVHSNEIGAMGGSRRSMPLTAGVFVVGCARLSPASQASPASSPRTWSSTAVEGKARWVPWAPADGGRVSHRALHGACPRQGLPRTAAGGCVARARARSVHDWAARCSWRCLPSSPGCSGRRSPPQVWRGVPPPFGWLTPLRGVGGGPGSASRVALVVYGAWWTARTVGSDRLRAGSTRGSFVDKRLGAPLPPRAPQA